MNVESGKEGEKRKKFIEKKVMKVQSGEQIKWKEEGNK